MREIKLIVFRIRPSVGKWAHRGMLWWNEAGKILDTGTSTYSVAVDYVSHSFCWTVAADLRSRATSYLAFQPLWMNSRSTGRVAHTKRLQIIWQQTFKLAITGIISGTRPVGNANGPKRMYPMVVWLITIICSVNVLFIISRIFKELFKKTSAFQIYNLLILF